MSTAYDATVESLRQRLEDALYSLEEARGDLHKNVVQTAKFSNDYDHEVDMHLKTKITLAEAQTKILDLERRIEEEKQRARSAIQELADYHNERRSSHHTLESLPPK